MRHLTCFIFDLVQDLTVFRPVIILAKQLNRSIVILVSAEFLKRDETGIWRVEAEQLCAEVEGELIIFNSELDVFAILSRAKGMLFSASESTVRAHAGSRRMFLAAPKSFTTVTLQHGYECIGFVHNERHSRVAGVEVEFAADIVVSWLPRHKVTAIAGPSRDKLYVAGPTQLIIPRVADESISRMPHLSGVICENLHSVRFAASSARHSFLEIFAAFAERMGRLQIITYLRSHPAGRFADKNNVPIPAGVRQSTKPLYNEDLGRFAFAISAPSSILIDFVLAGVPAAVWADKSEHMDASNYAGLPLLSTVEDWWRFAMKTLTERDAVLTNQSAFLLSLEFPKDVENRYARLLSLV